MIVDEVFIIYGNVGFDIRIKKRKTLVYPARVIIGAAASPGIWKVIQT